VLTDGQLSGFETAAYNRYQLQIMVADPQFCDSWMDETNESEVNTWIGGLGHRPVSAVTSRAIGASAQYYGAPTRIRKAQCDDPHCPPCGGLTELPYYELPAAARPLATPSLRSFPARLGISRSLTGRGRKLPERSSSRSPSTNFSTPTCCSTWRAACRPRRLTVTLDSTGP
jgi:hypothetical protein